MSNIQTKETEAIRLQIMEKKANAFSMISGLLEANLNLTVLAGVIKDEKAKIERFIQSKEKELDKKG